jgi:predicted transcriptional regulator YheO
MNIKVTDYANRTKTISLSAYVSRFPASSEGVAERAQDTADHTLDVLGNLVEKLVEKGVFSLEDAVKVVDKYSSDKVELA